MKISIIRVGPTPPAYLQSIFNALQTNVEKGNFFWNGFRWISNPKAKAKNKS